MKYLPIFLIMVGSAFGATYYVDASTGDDTNDGSSGSPWKSLERAKAYPTAPTDHYRLGMSKDNATPFILEEEVRDDAGDRAFLKSFVNGEMIVDRFSGDWTNNPVNITGQVSGATANTYTGSTLLVYDPLVGEGDTVLFKDGDYGEYNQSTDNNPASAFFRDRDGWVTYKADIGETAVNFTNILVENVFEGTHGKSRLIFDGLNITEGFSIQKTKYFTIQNCIATTVSSLDIAGGAGFYEPYYSTLDKIIDATEVDYLTVDNCTLTDAYQGVWSKGPADYATIKNNTIFGMAGDGILVVSTNNTLIEDNTISEIDNRNGQITIRTSDAITGSFVVGEEITQAGTGAIGQFASLLNATNIIIYTTSETLFETAANSGGTITGATASMPDISLVDPVHTDGIEIQGNGMVNIIIRRNSIVRPIPEVSVQNAQGIKCITTSGVGAPINGAIIENNLVKSERPFLIGGIDGLEMNNNTFIGSSSGRFYLTSDAASMTINSFHNNFLTILSIDNPNSGKTITILSNGNNIFEDDPNGEGGIYETNDTELLDQDFSIGFFTDYDNDDFTLAVDSPAIDFGNAAFAPIDNILGETGGSTSDTGAYGGRSTVGGGIRGRYTDGYRTNYRARYN